MALTETETDALADKIAQLAITWANDDPGGLEKAIAIIKKTPCLGRTDLPALPAHQRALAPPGSTSTRPQQTTSYTQRGGRHEGKEAHG